MNEKPGYWLCPRDMAEAKQAQTEMAQQVILEDDLPDSIRTIGGADISHTPFDPKQLVYGAVVLLSYPSFALKEQADQIHREKMPYIPGFLGFREAPTLVKAFHQLTQRPDLLMVDGHGASHPRGLGIASHLGVLLDIPTIGVAKSILVGKPALPIPEAPNSWVDLEWKGHKIGVCLRTKKHCLPLIISAGHKISLATAVQWVLRCLQSYRLPEPTRMAHISANECRKKSCKII